jgi:hypothetical protein
MSAKDAEALYNSFLESGDLLEMFPNMKGEWSKDKSSFLSLYQFNEDTLGDSHIKSLDDVYDDEY